MARRLVLAAAVLVQRCLGGWRGRRYALPSGVEATGGSYLSCRRGRAHVFWAEHGE
jgi:hypothetical protein